VGIQNEVTQPEAIWREMTLALRKALDKAGFQGVRIHMQNSSTLGEGVAGARAFTSSAEVWKRIDYAASNMYDYQRHFHEPDGFDATLREFKGIIGEQLFISTELSVNNDAYQTRSFWLAFAMGQQYHKNLTLADACAILYCWTLLNVEQPSYGWTRTLMVPGMEQGGVPASTSHQLRVLGAYSRRVKEGMARVETRVGGDRVLATAFEGQAGERTVILLNRSLAPQRAAVKWLGRPFLYLETASQHEENTVRTAPRANGAGTTEVTVTSGELVTLTNVELNRGSSVSSGN
jgi:hypothetical protein